MALEEFLCWGGQRLPLTVGLQRSLYSDAPTAEVSKLERQDRFARVGVLAAFWKINLALHVHL